jgi:hypothetical protein
MSTDDLDGVLAAPDLHKVIFENEAVRVLETTIRAGGVTLLHTHLTPTVMYVISGSHSIRRDEHGATMLDTRVDPDFVLPRVLYSTSNPRHTLENTGSDDLLEHETPGALVLASDCTGGVGRDDGARGRPERVADRERLRVRHVEGVIAGLDASNRAELADAMRK